MPSLAEWKVPPAIQPRTEDYGFDLEHALAAVVGLHSIIPPDAYTADTLGTERAGNGVVIGDGLVLTIGYLITEAETVWLHLGDGRVVEGHALGSDSETGFGLVQALGRTGLPTLPLGSSADARIGFRRSIGMIMLTCSALPSRSRSSCSEPMPINSPLVEIRPVPPQLGCAG